jgi:hypothetical protein
LDARTHAILLILQLHFLHGHKLARRAVAALGHDTASRRRERCVAWALHCVTLQKQNALPGQHQHQIAGLK